MNKTKQVQINLRVPNEVAIDLIDEAALPSTYTLEEATDDIRRLVTQLSASVIDTR